MTTCRDPKTAVKYLQNMGIKSKLAIYTIIGACASEQSYKYDRSLKSIGKQWLEEVRKAEVVYNECLQFLTKEQQNFYFALKILYLLEFKDTTENACPYAIGAKNFIIMLLETKKCLCLCYTFYVVALAEEFGLHLIRACPMALHIYVYIVKENGNTKKKLLLGKLKNVKIFPKKGQKVSVLTKELKERLNLECRIPDFFGKIDSGFTDNDHIKVKTDAATMKSVIAPYFPEGLVKNDLSSSNCTTMSVDDNNNDADWTIVLSHLRELMYKKTMNLSRFSYFLDCINAVYAIDLSYFAKLFDLTYPVEKIAANTTAIQQCLLEILDNINEQGQYLGVMPNTEELLEIYLRFVDHEYKIEYTQPKEIKEKRPRTTLSSVTEYRLLPFEELRKLAVEKGLQDPEKYKRGRKKYNKTALLEYLKEK
jgi:hypothetical protein